MRRWIGSDLGFKVGTGVFAAFLVVIVAGIGVELWRQSQLSIDKFGFAFWVGPGGRIQRRVAPEALVTMKDRVRQLTGRSRGRRWPRPTSG